MARFLGLDELFEGRHFDREIIVLCVRWYLRFKPSFRDLVEMMAERGLSMAHTTIMRWVHYHAPEFEPPLEPVRAVGRSVVACGRDLREDPRLLGPICTGRWIVRANTVDFRLSPKRDVAAAKAFFRKAIEGQGASPADHHAGRLCRIAPRRARDEGRRGTARRYQAAVIEISEQPDRAGPSGCETADRSDARVQAVQDRSDHHSGDRTAAADPQGAVQPQPAAPSGSTCACHLGCGTGSPVKADSTQHPHPRALVLQAICTRATGSAVRRTRRGREIVKPLWSRIPPAVQLSNVFRSAVGRQMRRALHCGIQIQCAVAVFG